MKKVEKNKEKKSKKKWIFVVISKMAIVSLLVGICFIAPTIAVVYHNKQKILEEKMFGNKSEYQGIITLWNVDTFEGGSSSRSGFLEGIATKFEKKNKGAYIKVENLTIDEMVACLKMGKTPNLYSFGTGVSHFLEQELIVVDASFEGEIRSNFLASGLKNGALKAIPWCVGGYSLISTTEKVQKAKGDEGKSLYEQAFELAFDTIYKKSTKHTYSITFGKNDYVDGLSVFSRTFTDKSAYELASAGKIDIKYNEQSPYDAYVNFISCKSSILLGTQRDLARMESRVSSGVEQDFLCEPLKEYTDLVSYISIVKSEDKVQRVCERFIKFLLSDEVQLLLKNIGMLSATNLDIYSDGTMDKLEDAITEKTIVKNAF